MKVTKIRQGLLYLTGAYIQLILCSFILYLPSFLAYIYIALLFSIYSTVVFAAIRKRPKKLIYAVGGGQFILWTTLGFYQFPVFIFLLFLSMFLVFGLSAMGLAILFSDKTENKNNILKI